MGLSPETLIKINNEIEMLLEEYKDFETDELARCFDVSMQAKNSLNVLTKRMLEYVGAKSIISEQIQESLVVKTVKLDKYGRLKESMSFPTFKYIDLVKEDWMQSSLRKLFYDKTYAFVVYQNVGKLLYLKKIMLWQMPLDVLDESVKLVWDKMRECLQSGNIVKYIDDSGRFFTFFPTSTDNPYVHVRPHAQNRDDTYDLPVRDKLTGLLRYPKHCFWLNRTYVLRIIEGKC